MQYGSNDIECGLPRPLFEQPPLITLPAEPEAACCWTHSPRCYWELASSAFAGFAQRDAMSLFNRVSDISGGPSFLHVAGTLWKKGARVGWVKRYMSINTQQFTYYNKSSDSFPLGFIDTHDILVVKELDKNNGRRFDVIANSQVIKLMAPDAKEAETWVKTIRAITDSVQHKKFAKQNLRRIGQRKLATPQWKKKFWDESKDGGAKDLALPELRQKHRQEPAHTAGTELRDSKTASQGLFDVALGKPRLLKKLLTEYNNDIKILQLVIKVLLTEEHDQKPFEDAKSAGTGRSSSASIDAAAVVAEASVRPGGKPSAAGGIHRRGISVWSSMQGFQRAARPAGKMLMRSNSGMLFSAPRGGSKAKASKVDPVWFYQDVKKQPEGAASFEECFDKPRVMQMFKTYLRALYQDGGLLFVCDVHNFQRKRDSSGKELKGAALVREGERIFDHFVKENAERSLDVDESARRFIQNVLQGSNPETAFRALRDERMQDVVAQFKEFQDSDFFGRISLARGPIAQSNLARKFAEGEVAAGILVWRDGTKISLWRPAESIPVFQEAIDEYKHQGELSEGEVKTLFLFLTGERRGGIDLVTEGMRSKSPAVRSLAYRALWLLLRARLGYDASPVDELANAFVEIMIGANETAAHVTPINFIMENHSCLVSMVFNKCKDFAADFEDESKALKPGTSVYNVALWPAVFANLNGTNLYPRLKCLQDAYFHLIKNKVNPKSMIQMNDWAAWLLPLTFDQSNQSKADPVTKLRTYVKGVITSTLWNLVETGASCEEYARNLRSSVALTVSLGAEDSVKFSVEILAACISHFHSESKKWGLMEKDERIERIKCIQHTTRLLLALALNLTSRQFAVRDRLKTHKFLPKELWEKHHVEPQEEEQKAEEKAAPTGKLAALHVANEGRGRVASLSVAVSANRASGRASIFSVSTRGGGGTSGSGGMPLNDQEILYVLKAVQHARESMMRSAGGKSEARLAGMMSSFNLNHVIQDGKDDDAAMQGGTDSQRGLLRLDDKRFLVSAPYIRATLGERLDELRASIEKYKDSDHICASEQFKTPITFHSYNLAWNESLPDYVDALHKVQAFLIELKHRHTETKDGSGSLATDATERAVWDKLLEGLPFVNDSITFLDLMNKRLWALLDPPQVYELIHKFARTGDVIKRRKVFHGWEKQKKKRDARINKALEKKLKVMEERAKRTYTMMLIGPGQSGKSTIFKQLTILHGRGFSDRQKRSFRAQIYTNVVGALKNLLAHMKRILARNDESLIDMSNPLAAMKEILDQLRRRGGAGDDATAARIEEHIRALNNITGLEKRYRAYLLDAAADDSKLQMALATKREMKDTKAKCAKFSEVEAPRLVETFYDGFKLDGKNEKAATAVFEAPYQNVEMTSKFKAYIRSLWADPAIQNVYLRKDRFKSNQLDDSAVYMLDNLDRILSSQSEYLPSKADILHCRQRTLGIVEGEFEISGQIFKIVDVAGQRGARNKWIPLFQSAQACLFVCSLAGYNRYLLEDKEKLRIHEALDLFEDIINQRALARVPIILFMNKIDLFERDLQHTSLRKAFPQYSGPEGNAGAAATFVKHRFKKRVRDPNRQIVVHTTCATDTNQVGKILDSVTKIIIEKQLMAAGLL